MTRWLWPVVTGRTFFDVWSVVHLAFWLVVGANIRALVKGPRVTAYAACIAAAYAWEVFEKWWMEPRGYVLHPESWLNRWLSDPLMCVLGVLAGVALIARQ